MWRLTKLTDKMSSKICESPSAVDLCRLTRKRDILHKQQLMDSLENVCLKAESDLNGTMFQRKPNSVPLDDECVGIGEVTGSDLIEKKDDLWFKFMTTFGVLSTYDHYEFFEERKCVQIPITKQGFEIDFFLRKGVRCFMIDLFLGTFEQNQKLLVLLRKIELKISHEFGYPVRSTVIARISPRLQFTGSLVNESGNCLLLIGDEIILTSKRVYSRECNSKYVYVNAVNILKQLRIHDCIVIYNTIKISVTVMHEHEVECRVVCGGILKSRSPVTFPERINRLQVSNEELEDIVFCKEMGINVIYSAAPGILPYLKDLQEVLKNLECSHIKLGACVNLNNTVGEGNELAWVAENYDMFLIYINPPNNENITEVLHMSPAIKQFLHHAYLLQKPIIFDGTEIATCHYIIDPRDCYLIYFYPDRYVVNRKNLCQNIYFSQLQTLIFKPLPTTFMLEQSFIDDTPDGSLTLARNVVAISLEISAPLILVSSRDGILAQQISHFRPKSNIISVVRGVPKADHIALSWNITNLFYHSRQNRADKFTIFKKLLFALTYAYDRGLVSNDAFIVLAFSVELHNEFQLIRFDEKMYTKHLKKLFLES